MRVAPCVRTCAVRWLAVVVGAFGLEDRLRVWENVEGARTIKVKRVMVMRFKVMFLLCCCSQIDRYFSVGGVIVPKTNAAVRMTLEGYALVAS